MSSNNDKIGIYLICIIRNNGTFYKYDQTDDINKAVSMYIGWKDKTYAYDDFSEIRNSTLKNNFNKRGILNNFDRPHLYLIDLTASDSKVLSDNSLASQEHLRKYKRVKRIFKLNCLI